MTDFGSSGLRGLVSDLTPELVAAYARAFLSLVPDAECLLIGRDLRASSPGLSQVVANAAAACGVRPLDCGEVPTPALALAAETASAPAIMVTGSHIPDDRNGLKFYRPDGEITKADERAISRAFAALSDAATAPATRITPHDALGPFIDRYTAFFTGKPLSGLRLGVYQHSSVARDLLPDLLDRLGAKVVPIGRTAHFVAVDTEAIDRETRAMLRDWSARHRLDAILSTDGDADRPLLTDETGRIIPGDVIGMLTAQALGATHLATPLTTSSFAETSGWFSHVARCPIGSPFVIQTMSAQRAAGARVVGFEPNGGFLLGFEARRADRRLAPLMTRDFALPLLSTLVAARDAGMALSALAATLPARFTARDRLRDVAPEISARIIEALAVDPALLPPLADEPILSADRTDGLRLTLSSGRIVHIRASANAPELRCYVEDASAEVAETALASLLAALARQVDAHGSRA